MSAVALLILVAALAMMDGRVRDRFTPTGVWSRVTNQRGQIAMTGANVYEVIAEHDKLAMFVVAGSLLVGCMLRT